MCSGKQVIWKDLMNKLSYNMMFDIGKNVVYRWHKFVGGLGMNDFRTESFPGDLALMKAEVTEERKGHSGLSTQRLWNLE
jgi:hypothetical protein